MVLKKQAISGLGVGDVVNITAVSSSESNMTASGRTFGSLKVGNIIRYSDGTGDEIFNEVKSISSDLKTVTLEAAPLDITGICDKDLPSSAIQVSGVGKGIPQIFQNDVGLYAPLSKKNISDVALGESKLFIKAQVAKTASAQGVLTVSTSDFTGIPNATFAPFDADRYSISRNNGGDTRHTTLDSSQVTLSNNNTTITFTGLESFLASQACAVTVSLE